MHSTRCFRGPKKYGRNTFLSVSLRHNSSAPQTLLSHPNDSTASQNQNQNQNRSPSTVLDDPIPTKPTWSIHSLLSSYPRPQITPSQLTKLYELSGLLPPKEGEEESERVRKELEEFVRLVEAVRFVDGGDEGGDVGLGENADANGNKDATTIQKHIPDGRIRESQLGINLSPNTHTIEFDDPSIESGKQLLKHAKLTKDGFYVVEADRRRKK